MIATTPAGASCPKCGRADAKINTKHPVCPRCQAAIRREASQQQEADYLARWLSTRIDAHGFVLDDAMPRHVGGKLYMLHLIEEARRLNLDWVTPPAPLHFDTRLAGLMKAYVSAGNKRGRPVRAKDVHRIGAVSLWSASA